jgi:hypothetical protein
MAEGREVSSPRFSAKPRVEIPKLTAPEYLKHLSLIRRNIPHSMISITKGFAITRKKGDPGNPLDIALRGLLIVDGDNFRERPIFTTG